MLATVRNRRGVVAAVEPLGFHTDVVADVLSLPDCPDATTAYSVLEALRLGAARVLDMHLNDLQVLVVGHVERETLDALLWDPMPGGSGLTGRLVERFEEITKVAREIVADCPGACDASCIDCLQSFRNAYYHRFLHREVARARLDDWGTSLRFAHDIPPLNRRGRPGRASRRSTKQKPGYAICCSRLGSVRGYAVNRFASTACWEQRRPT